MKFLMLRGEVVKDRPVQEIIFDSIKESDDIWSHFLYALLNKNDYGEIWYYNGPYREHKLASNLMEKWVQNFAAYKSKFIPDIIFARGAFKEFHSILKRFPNAFKIRYAAGRRYIPAQGFYDYDLILQDSPEQLKECRRKFPNIPSTLFIKSAPDNLFFPMPEIEKEYDVCFPANGSQAFKGFDFVYSTVPKDIKLLNLGNNPNRFKHPDNVTAYRVLKSEMPKHIAKCKMGIVAVSSKIDSCPRIISELLACGLPIVVLDDVRFWKEKYIVSGVTGELANKGNFWDVVKHVLNNVNSYNPREYYKENLSLKIAAKFLRGKINETMLG